MTCCAGSSTFGVVNLRTRSSSTCSAGRLSSSRRLPEPGPARRAVQLVELPGPQQRLCRPGAVHHHVTVAGRRAGLRGALAHLGDVVGRRPAAGRPGRRGSGRHRCAVVGCACHRGRAHRAAAGDDRASGHQLGEHSPFGPGRCVGRAVDSGTPDAHARPRCRRVRRRSRPGHGMLQPDDRHLLSPPIARGIAGAALPASTAWSRSSSTWSGAMSSNSRRPCPTGRGQMDL